MKFSGSVLNFERVQEEEGVAKMIDLMTSWVRGGRCWWRWLWFGWGGTECPSRRWSMQQQWWWSSCVKRRSCRERTWRSHAPVLQGTRWEGAFSHLWPECGWNSTICDKVSFLKTRVLFLLKIFILSCYVIENSVRKGRWHSKRRDNLTI